MTKHIVLIGSWVEYFYDEYFSDDYYPNIVTRDVDFLYRNIRLPNHKIQLIAALRNHGFVYDENPMTKVARFFRRDEIEIEFITRVIGQDQMYYFIESLGIVAEGLREVNLLQKYSTSINRSGVIVNVPEPAAYVIHKILINKKRMKVGKAEKDMRSIKDLINHIMNHPSQRALFVQITQELTKKELTVFKRVCEANEITLDFMDVPN